MSTLARTTALAEDRWPAENRVPGDPLGQVLLASHLLGSDRAVSNYGGLGSFGAELNLNAAILSWDSPYRFRFGVAAPYHDEGLLTAAKSVSWYFASGLAFLTACEATLTT